MSKFQIFALITAIIMLSVAGVAMVSYYHNSNNEKVLNTVIETATNTSIVGPNTTIYLQTCYKCCNHNNVEQLDNNKYINCTFDEVAKKYEDYEVKTSNSTQLMLEKQENSYCNYHYTLKTIDDKIGIYNKINYNNNKLYDILDVNIDTLRDSDKFLFIDTGIDIYGNENLYKVIEDFSS